MAFGANLGGEHLMMAASAKTFYFVIKYKNKTYMELAASNINIKCISWKANSWCPPDHCTAEYLRGDCFWITCRLYLFK